MQGFYKRLKNLTGQIFPLFAVHTNIIPNHNFFVVVVKFPIEIIKPQEVKCKCKVLLISDYQR